MLDTVADAQPMSCCRSSSRGSFLQKAASWGAVIGSRADKLELLSRGTWRMLAKRIKPAHNWNLPECEAPEAYETHSQHGVIGSHLMVGHTQVGACNSKRQNCSLSMDLPLPFCHCPSGECAKCCQTGKAQRGTPGWPPRASYNYSPFQSWLAAAVLMTKAWVLHAGQGQLLHVILK